MHDPEGDGHPHHRQLDGGQPGEPARGVHATRHDGAPLLPAQDAQRDQQSRLGHDDQPVPGHQQADGRGLDPEVGRDEQQQADGERQRGGGQE